MRFGLKKLTPHIGAEVSGVNLTSKVNGSLVDDLKAGLDDYSVLVFRDQQFDDVSQTEFSAQWDRSNQLFTNAKVMAAFLWPTLRT